MNILHYFLFFVLPKRGCEVAERGEMRLVISMFLLK